MPNAIPSQGIRIYKCLRISYVWKAGNDLTHIQLHLVLQYIPRVFDIPHRKFRTWENPHGKALSISGCHLARKSCCPLLKLLLSQSPHAFSICPLSALLFRSISIFQRLVKEHNRLDDHETSLKSTQERHIYVVIVDGIISSPLAMQSWANTAFISTLLKNVHHYRSPKHDWNALCKHSQESIML